MEKIYNIFFIENTIKRKNVFTKQKKYIKFVPRSLLKLESKKVMCGYTAKRKAYWSADKIYKGPQDVDRT